MTRQLTLTLALSLFGCGNSEEGPPPIRAADVQTFLQDTALEQSPLSVYIRGKVLVINRTDRRVEEDVQSLLAPARNAHVAQEVETVVWIDWTTQEIPGQAYQTVFQKTGPSRKVQAMVWNANLTVVDWKRKQLLGGTLITGAGPTEHYEKRSNEDLSKAGGIAGPRPFQAIADYLADTAQTVAVPP